MDPKIKNAPVADSTATGAFKAKHRFQSTPLLLADFFVPIDVNKIATDKMKSLAQRKGVSVQKIERWMSPVLAYEQEVVTE